MQSAPASIAGARLARLSVGVGVRTAQLGHRRLTIPSSTRRQKTHANLAAYRIARSRGAPISFKSSSHFAPLVGSKFEKPVMFAPGRAKLETKPCATGSLTTTNTMGIVRVACCSAANPSTGLTRMTSGSSLSIPWPRPVRGRRDPWRSEGRLQDFDRLPNPALRIPPGMPRDALAIPDRPPLCPSARRPAGRPAAPAPRATTPSRRQAPR